ncbi:calpain-5 isoform X1 [Poecilia reticulata]|uniref:calpain-5 isoform X1 n=1 Tax=Poecilia reticulata TaxID=8081 RepID=UPI0004A4EF43|nr:PREDICTED: calpain-5-like isoform X1 [Poecilia reticulata]
MLEAVNDFKGQSFDKLRRSCLRRGALFKDPLFPATNQSLFYKRSPPPGLTWKRPREICRDPRLFVDGISTRDLHQGSLGNCWMVAAISCLASEPSLWKKVIPNHMDQEWNEKRSDLYAGIFHFRFWRFGHWVDVVVDDCLPVSQDGVLLFCRSATPREFWSALLEKAYAKLNGCYEALEGGNTAEALIDFTGGVSEPLSLDCEALGLSSERRKALFQTLAKVHEHKSLITCSIRPAEGETVESVLDCGLVRGHAYGITAVRKVRLVENPPRTGGTSRLFMVRMRNPWGTTDWKGAWSQGSEQWQQLSRAEREKMGIVVRDVGEFWMDFQDFCCYFTDVVVCRLVQRTLLWPSSHWRETQSYGEWAPSPDAPGTAPVSAGKYSSSAQALSNIRPAGKKVRESSQEGTKRREVTEEMDRRSRCGGCINHRDSFLHNPQFMFEVQSKEEEVLICLQQEDRRVLKKNGGGENLPIGFEVLKVEVNRCSRVQLVVEQAASSIYMDSRSVTLRGTLASGRYVVLPTTFLPGDTGRFLLRLFSHSHVQLRELKKELPSPSVFQCFLPQPAVVTTIHLRRASGLKPPKQTGGLAAAAEEEDDIFVGHIQSSSTASIRPVFSFFCFCSFASRRVFCLVATAPDVYAVVRCEGDAVRTRVFKEDGNPEFNLRAIFYRRYPDNNISVELWSTGLLWDSLLGAARLQTTEFERSRSLVIDLRRGRSRSGSRGCVHVETSTSACLTDL